MNAIAKALRVAARMVLVVILINGCVALMPVAAVILAPGGAWWLMRRAMRRLLRRRISRAEKKTRRAVGMPAGHPERFTTSLPRGEEDMLAALAAAMWPDGEYAAICDEFRRPQ